jgi:hypothetical protein
MSEPAPSADDFWAAVTGRGFGFADTEVMADDELLELAAGLGPVLISQRGVEALVTAIPVPPPGHDEVVFHTEDAPAGERVAWVVLHCTGLDGLLGGETALAGADAIVERLGPAGQALAEDAVGIYTLYSHSREWRLLTRLVDGGWSIDLPGAARRPGDGPRRFGEITIPDAAHRGIADLVEAIAAEVSEPVEWAPGRVLIFDNRRYLHARLPVLCGARELRRVLVGPVPGGGVDRTA